MSSKTKTETQSKIKDYTNWQLEEDLEKMYDTMGFDDNGKVLTREEKYQRMLKEWEERTLFKSVSFPTIRNFTPTTISGEIKSAKPRPESKIKEQYTNHWGDDVRVYENGTAMGISHGSHSQFGDYGHDFLNGWFVIDEIGNPVYFENERYTEITHKSLNFWEVINRLQQIFPSPNYRVERGRERKLFVNDKEIKGVEVYPGKEILSIKDEVQAISELIQKDIVSRRIQPKKFGIE